jgi:hypothetical protein
VLGQRRAMIGDRAARSTTSDTLGRHVAPLPD